MEELTEEDMNNIAEENIEKSHLWNCGYIGAIVWKRFSLNGKVKQCLIGKRVIFDFLFFLLLITNMYPHKVYISLPSDPMLYLDDKVSIFQCSFKNEASGEFFDDYLDLDSMMKQAQKKTRKNGCRKCENCKKPDCRVCVNCLDMKKYRGKGKKKQKCMDRKCLRFR